MDKEILNYYCDESCHLENDKKKYMLLGLVSCKKTAVKEINERIKDIKKENGINEHTEVKWTKLSPKKIGLYKDLINYFFDNPNISFKTIIIDKSTLDHKGFAQTHDEFYYKMYYVLFNSIINPRYVNKFFVDEKDTNNFERIQKLERILYNTNYDYQHEIIAPIQLVKSHNIPLMQIVDILLGLMSYFCNIENKSATKQELINLVTRRSGYSLNISTLPSESKFNIFYFKGNRHESADTELF